VSRAVGQVSTLQATVGACVVLAFVAAIIVMSDWLLLPTERVPALESALRATPDAQPTPCPASGTSPLEVSSATLIDCPAEFDGRTVVFVGEVVGAVLRRGSHAWLQLNDDSYALAGGPLPTHRITAGGNAGLAVRVPAAVADGIEHVGGHRARGDVLHVTGVFEQTHPADAGGPAIEAREAHLVRRGEDVTHPVHRRRLAVAVVLQVCTGLVVLLTLQRARTR
jgi:hypothetical protein